MTLVPLDAYDAVSLRRRQLKFHQAVKKVTAQFPALVSWSASLAENEALLWYDILSPKVEKKNGK